MHYNTGPFDLFSYITNPDVFKVHTGMISLLEGPGLGIQVNEDLIRSEDAKYRAGHVSAWRNPIWRGADGAIREW